MTDEETAQGQELPSAPPVEEVQPDWTSVVLLAAPPVPLEVFRARRWEALKAARDAAIDGGVDTPFGRFDTDATSRALLGDAVLGAQIMIAQNLPFEVTWTLADNSSVTLTAQQLVQVGLLALAHVAACHDRGRQRRAQLAAATTREAIEGVVW